MIPSYLGEPLEPPPVSPARGPPADWGEIVQVHVERDGFQAAGGRAARDRQSLAVTPTQPTGRCPDAETIVSAHHRHRLRGADGGEQGIEPTATPPRTQGRPTPPSATIFDRPAPPFSTAVNTRLPLIKPVALGEISLGIGGDADDHRPSCIKRAFASGQAAIVARPSSRRRLRSSSTSRCHSGDLTSQGCAQRLCHTLSRS
jgi:hypothetical protein